MDPDGNVSNSYLYGGYSGEYGYSGGLQDTSERPGSTPGNAVVVKTITVKGKGPIKSGREGLNNGLSPESMAYNIGNTRGELANLTLDQLDALEAKLKAIEAADAFRERLREITKEITKQAVEEALKNANISKQMQKARGWGERVDNAAMVAGGVAISVSPLKFVPTMKQVGAGLLVGGVIAAFAGNNMPNNPINTKDKNDPFQKIKKPNGEEKYIPPSVRDPNAPFGQGGSLRGPAKPWTTDQLMDTAYPNGSGGSYGGYNQPKY